MPDVVPRLRAAIGGVKLRQSVDKLTADGVGPFAADCSVAPHSLADPQGVLEEEADECHLRGIENSNLSVVKNNTSLTLFVRGDIAHRLVERIGWNFPYSVQLLQDLQNNVLDLRATQD
jgi:hypothetical protein